jgi:hypothetical protein
MGTTNVPWAKEAEAELVRLWRSGKTGEVIAGELGVSRSAVLGKAARLGLYRQKPRNKRRVGPVEPSTRMTLAAAREVISRVQPDRRSLSQKLLGDPPPGRSALDKRNSHNPQAAQ